MAEQVAQLTAPTERDIKDQDMIRRWRLRALTANTEALGRDYCASLINLSEIGGQETINATRHSVALNGNPVIGQHGSGSSAAGDPDSSGGPERGVRAVGWSLIAPTKGSSEAKGRPPGHGAPVRRADAGDGHAVEQEL